MEISTNNTLTTISYGAFGCVGLMAAANVFLVSAGASAKVSAYVADYFKNESVAQNLRIKGDHLISLAGKYAATELKLVAALAAVGGSAALAQYAMDNEVPEENPVKPDENPVKPDENPVKPDENPVKPDGKSENPSDTKNEKLPEDLPGKVNEVIPHTNVQPIGKFKYCVGPDDPYCLGDFDKLKDDRVGFFPFAFGLFAFSLLVTVDNYFRRVFEKL